MRVYGTSPLYNYVELIFRCRRMFVICVIVGTVLMSGMMYFRKDMYEASMLIALTGNTTAVSVDLATGDERTRREAVSAASRKATRLSKIWIPEDPTFLDEAMKEQSLDRVWGAEYEKKLELVRDKIAIGNELLGGQYLKVGIQWESADEAEKILNGIYSRFSRKTVDEENAMAKFAEQALKTQFAEFDAKAKAAGLKKIKYIQEHYRENPIFMQGMLGKVEQWEYMVNEAEGTLAEMRTKLAAIEKQLKSTLPRIQGSVVSGVTKPDLTEGARAEKTEKEKQLAQALGRYSEQHPVVTDLKKQIANLTAQIETLSKQPQPEVPSSEQRTTEANPLYGELMKQKQMLAAYIPAMEKRVQKTRELIARDNATLQRMPSGQREWERVTRDATVAENIRNTIEAQLRAAEIEAKRNELTESLQVKQAIAPKAEKLIAGAKGVLLYLLGPILGIIIAFCFSLVAETLDHTLRTPVEVERHLGKPVLAAIPKMKSARPSRKQLAGASRQSISS